MRLNRAGSGLVSAGPEVKESKGLRESTEGRTYVERWRLMKTRDGAGFPLVIARRNHPGNNLWKKKEKDRESECVGGVRVSTQHKMEEGRREERKGGTEGERKGVREGRREGA